MAIRQFPMEASTAAALDKLRGDLLTKHQREIDSLVARLATAKSDEMLNSLNTKMAELQAQRAKILVSNIILAAVAQFLAKPPSTDALMQLVLSSRIARGRPRVRAA